MARIAKSLKAPEQGYRHRDHRAAKNRANVSRVVKRKRKQFRDRLEELEMRE